MCIFIHCVVCFLASNLNMINSYWTTFETLADIKRDCKERQLYMDFDADTEVLTVR